MGNSLLERANRFMGKTIYEQEELETTAKLSEIDEEETEDELVVSTDDDTEELEGDDLEGDDLDDAEGTDELEDGEEEEIPLMPVEAAIRAIQMALNGEVESAQEALDLVQDTEDSEEGEEGDELESDELDTDDMESDEEEVEEGCATIDETDDDFKPISPDFKEPKNAKKIISKDFKEIGDDIDDEDDKMYGECHSKFLRLSQRYL